MSAPDRRPLLSECIGDPQPPYETSLWSVLQAGLDLNPNSAALISVRQGPSHLANLVGSSPDPTDRGVEHDHGDSDAEMLKWSYAQMQRGAARMSTVLARHGISPESTLLTLIPQCAEWTLLLWTAAVHRLTTVSRMAQVLLLKEKKGELRAWFERMTPAAVVVEDENGAKIVDELRRDLRADQSAPFLGICLKELSETKQSWISMADINRLSFTEEESTVSTVEDRLDRVVHVYLTSGTSGTPKGVMRTVRNICASSSVLTAPPTIGPAVGGNFAGMAMTVPYLLWRRGGTLVLPGPSFSWSQTIHAIEACGITEMCMMRGHVGLMTGDKAFSPERIRSLRWLIVTGELMTEAFVHKARKALGSGRVTISCVLAMSEVSGILGWPNRPPDPLPAHQGVVSSGMATRGTRVRIVDENEAVVARGQEGELHVGSDGLTPGYTAVMGSLQEDRRLAFYEDDLGRWFKTGDMAVMDEQGRVYMVGRKKELIRNISGVVIHPHLIESCLSARFNVQVCLFVVFLEPHDMTDGSEDADHWPPIPDARAGPVSDFGATP